MTLRQTRNPGLSASKSGEEVKSKWIGVIGKNWSGVFESRGEKRFWIKEHPRQEEPGQYTALELGIGLRLFLSTRSMPKCNDCKEQNLSGIYTCPAEANPMEWDQLTGNASGEHRQIQLGGKYKSIRNENGWQELECTWRDTGWERMVKTGTKEHTKLPILNKKHQVEFFGGGFHRQISFHFKDIFG